MGNAIHRELLNEVPDSFALQFGKTARQIITRQQVPRDDAYHIMDLRSAYGPALHMIAEAWFTERREDGLRRCCHDMKLSCGQGNYLPLPRLCTPLRARIIDDEWDATDWKDDDEENGQTT